MHRECSFSQDAKGGGRLLPTGQPEGCTKMHAQEEAFGKKTAAVIGACKVSDTEDC